MKQTPYLAVSNLAPGGLPATAEHRNEEQFFETLEDARAWLRSLKCGGAISTHTGSDWEVIEAITGGE